MLMIDCQFHILLEWMLREPVENRNTNSGTKGTEVGLSPEMSGRLVSEGNSRDALCQNKYTHNQPASACGPCEPIQNSHRY